VMGQRQHWEARWTFEPAASREWVLKAPVRDRGLASVLSPLVPRIQPPERRPKGGQESGLRVARLWFWQQGRGTRNPVNPWSYDTTASDEWTYLSRLNLRPATLRMRSEAEDWMNIQWHVARCC